MGGEGRRGEPWWPPGLGRRGRGGGRGCIGFWTTGLYRDVLQVVLNVRGVILIQKAANGFATGSRVAEFQVSILDK